MGEAAVIDLAEARGKLNRARDLMRVAQDIRAERERDAAVYRAAARMLPGMAIIGCDAEERIFLADGDALKKAVMSQVNLVGKTLKEALGEGGYLAVKRHWDAVLGGEEFIDVHDSLNGRQYVVKGEPVRDPKGSVVMGLLLVFDVDEVDSFIHQARHRLTNEAGE